MTSKEPFEVITPDDIIRINGNEWKFKGEVLSKGVKDNLKAEADLIQKTQLWKLMLKECRYHAQKRGMIDAKNYEELGKARTLIDLTVLLETFVENIIKK